jgi:hypothetical protein
MRRGPAVKVSCRAVIAPVDLVAQTSIDLTTLGRAIETLLPDTNLRDPEARAETTIAEPEPEPDPDPDPDLDPDRSLIRSDHRSCTRTGASDRHFGSRDRALSRAVFRRATRIRVVFGA